MRLFALTLLLCSTAMVQAAVYVGDSYVWEQPDGTPVPVRIWGDEFSIDVETPDGWALRRDADRWWRYGRLAADGSLVPSHIAVGAGDPATLGVARHLRQSQAQRRATIVQQRAALQRDAKGRVITPEVNAMRTARGLQAGAPLAAPPALQTLGTRRGITILIQFSDRPADVMHSQATVDAFCNQVGYNGFGNNGSVRDYFYDNSLGRLTYTSQVTAYITAPQPRSYYTDPTVEFGTRARELVTSALVSINPDVNFADFDANNDGFIDAINIFYAGTCPNQWSEGLWPHQWSVNWNSGDSGVQSSVYQMTDMGPTLELGTFCHENGHMICDYPDIYDYDYDSVGGAGIFCLMNHGGQGTNPVRVCGYLALASGWRDVVDLYPASAPQTASVVAAATTLVGAPDPPEKDIYRFRKPTQLTEYFLIENRRATGRDANLPASGLAIWHVDERGDRDDQRYATNSANQNYEVALVQADDRFDFENGANAGDSTDLWFNGNPLSDGVFEDGLGDDPTANDARWWDGTPSNLVLDTISDPGATMSFNYRLPGPLLPPGEKLAFASRQVVDVEGSSGNRIIYLVVTREAGRTDDAHVDWATLPGSATADVDYTASSGTIDWAAGDTSPKTIAILINGDSFEEPDEFFTVQLSNPTGAGAPVLGANITMLIVLRNDDGASADLATTTAATIQANGTGDSGGLCGAGGIAGLLLGIGGLGLLRRRRR
jgi:M6 family metalloprotease-like protein